MSILLFVILSLFAEIRSKMEPILLVQGGAGDIPDLRGQNKIIGVKEAVARGYKVLKNGGSALDAVEEAVKYMEDQEAFNAGYGSVLNIEGEVEMDATIMQGSTLKSGGVTIVKDIAHPISLARKVMEKTPHFLLGGEGANIFAQQQKFERLPKGALVTTYAQEALEEFKKTGNFTSEIGEVGTVGAVAIDSKGRLAAATSTGGLTGKMVGRCSDSSVIGAGTYADDEVGAVSCTGHGETISRFCLSHEIISQMRNGSTAASATKQSLEKMTQRLKNTAGAVTLSKYGDIGIHFTTQRMAWAYQIKNEIHFGIDPNQHTKEFV